MQHARMPDLTWIAVLILTLAVILLAVTVRGLRSDLRETARRDEAADRQARALLARRKNQRDDPPDGEDGKRRHLWLVTIFAGLAAAAGWVRQHPGPAAAGAAAVGAAVLALLLPGAGTSEDAMPPTPPTTTSTAPLSRSPTLTSPVPAPGVPSKVPAGDTATSAVPPLDDASTSSTPTTTATTGSPPTTTTTTTTMPPTSSTQPVPALCLLEVELSPVLMLCLPVP